ncbi:MAG: glycosyltransferase family 4 protein [Nitrososphaerota archaeon]|nr:glycosyltransferase family 4 protein [Nitrososphaerota archaeon]
MVESFVVCVYGVNPEASEGATWANLTFWRSASQFARILIVTRGGSDTYEEVSNHLAEARIAAPFPSRNRLIRAIATTLFGGMASNVIQNLDDMVFAFRARVLLRKSLHSCTRVHTYSFWFTLMGLYPKTLRHKMVYTETGGDWIEVSGGHMNLLSRVRYMLLGRFVLNRVKVLVESNQNIAAMARVGVKRSNMHRFLFWPGRPSKYKPSTLQKSSDPFEVLFVGRLVPQKGLDTLVEAVDILVNQMQLTKVKFVLVGPAAGFGVQDRTPYFESIIKSIQKRGLSSKFQIMGYVPRYTLNDLYSRAMVHVMPSIHEAFGWVALEAMLCGTPSIVTTTSGVSDFIQEGVSGFVVEPRNPQRLAGRLEFLVRNKEVSIEMGRMARERASILMESFSKQQFIDVFAE